MENNKNISVTPFGEEFKIPQKEDYQSEFERIEALAKQAKKEGKEIVVVMGLGFVGVVMAAIVADTEENGKPSKLVIGCQRPLMCS